MVTINGEDFYGIPGSCGSCPFFFNASTPADPFGMVSGHCRMFDEMHHSWIDIPYRCQKLFKDALRYHDGTELTIIRGGGRSHGKR